MNKKRNLILLIIIVSSLTCCNYSRINQHLVIANSNLNELKKSFGADFLKSDLLSHFPNQIKDTTNFKMFASSPCCPPSYKHSAQFGKIYLICKKDSLTEIGLKNNSLFKSHYSVDSNIIINQTELRRDMFPVEKCNKSFDNKFPIPYFESYDFNLGEKEFEKIINGEKYWDYVHTIPSDLEVYVIQAEAGNFWKENCNENRPEILKEWKYGYSKGVAFSEEKDIMVYWAMVW